MKRKGTWFVAAAAGGAGALGIALYRRRRQAEGLAWERRARAGLDGLACPACRRGLKLILLPGGFFYQCPACQKEYPVVDGIPRFIQPEELTGGNKRFANMYDLMSWGYRAFSKIAFAYIGMSEEAGRREITDRLDPRGGRVLEVSVGPGVNLPYLVGRADVGEIYGLDISLGQLRRCRAYVARRGWNTRLQLGNAEMLPYQDDTFSGVFHIGGINFFNDKKKAIDEMVRVAKPGARILICDETEKGVRAYERFIPGFMKTVESQRQRVEAPVALVPQDMQELRLFEPWKGWMYCIEFRKPEGGHERGCVSRPGGDRHGGFGRHRQGAGFAPGGAGGAGGPGGTACRTPGGSGGAMRRARGRSPGPAHRCERRIPVQGAGGEDGGCLWAAGHAGQ